MRYTPQLYAHALFDALEENPRVQQEIAARFVTLLKRNGDTRLLPKVIAHLEKYEVHAAGGRMVKVESARPLPKKAMEAIRKQFSETDRVDAIILPELIAGVKIVIDDEWAIDASLKRKLQRLFPS